MTDFLINRDFFLDGLASFPQRIPDRLANCALFEIQLPDRFAPRFART
ncbi:MAG: hypothetical protein ABIL01_13885 [Pseudomonadota bacterium]